MKIYSQKNNTIKEVRVKPFRLEKDIQTLVEDNLDEFFGYQKVKSEFPVGSFRLDTLCFDKENKSFVIIEYKKDKNYSVIDQGFSYLSTVLDNKSDLILEYQDKFGKRLIKKDIDWTQTKVIFISPSFSVYQVESINFKDLPIELFEIKQYENDTISLLQHERKTKSTSINELSKSGVIDKVKREVKVFTEDEHFRGRPDVKNFIPKPNEDIVELYKKYKETIFNSFDSVTLIPRKYYLSFKIGKKTLVDTVFYKTKLKFQINVKKGKLDDSKNLCRDVSEIGHYGVGDYEITMKDEKNFEYIMSLIRQSYDINS